MSYTVVISWQCSCKQAKARVAKLAQSLLGDLPNFKILERQIFIHDPGDATIVDVQHKIQKLCIAFTSRRKTAAMAWADSKSKTGERYAGGTCIKASGGDSGQAGQ